MIVLVVNIDGIFPFERGM